MNYFDNIDCIEGMKELVSNSVDAVITDPPYGLSFMGKHWDYDVPKVEIWKEVLRVLKPGGYLLSFAGTRTQHRMACNIEDAGFEIRDMIAWVYGSGFPKSLNIGKAADKIQGNEREEIGEGKWNNRKPNGSLSETSFEGWGTALKPALEPITMARKPLSEKTVAENCLKWGTGGINIDECRVEMSQDDKDESYRKPLGQIRYGFVKTPKPEYAPQGRFPANLLHDGSDEVLDLFPDSKSGAMTKPYKYTNTGYSLGKPAGETKQIHEASSGSAARFFYCAKASKSERNLGCEDIEPNFIRRDDGQPYGMNTNKFRPDGSERKEISPQNNNHPTVKPIKLMTYLVKLVSRENSIILDPFAGSGTTGIACLLLNREYRMFERDKGYYEIAQKRLEQFRSQLKLAI